MRFGSLFTGIGGLDLGLERAGMQCAWQVEIDGYARRVLEKHWPAVRRWDDIRDTHGLPSVDLICGGFPCQDISVAGKGAGLAGARSGLWSEYRRIVEEVQPAWVLIENVPALRTRGLATVLSDLHACGYDAEWDGLSASAVGAPHRRDRIFVVAYSRSESLRLEQRRSRGADGSRAFVFGRNGESRDVANASRLRQSSASGIAEAAGGTESDRGCESGVGNTDRQGLAVGLQQSPRQERAPSERAGLQRNPWSVEPDVGGMVDGVSAGLDGPWDVEPNIPRVKHGVPSRVDRLKCLGNAVVPQVAEYIGRLILEAARD